MIFLQGIAILFAILFLPMWALYYNKFVSSKTKVQEGWSGIDVQLKKRHDIIPNLISIVKGYMKHEQSVLTEVTELRTKAMNSSDPAQIAEAENMLQGALKSLFAVSESYPDLKSSENFLQMQHELTEIEDQISAARRIYNQNATALNVLVESFPSNMLANVHNFKKVAFFSLDQTEREMPTIDF